jgi:hypothetical protein
MYILLLLLLSLYNVNGLLCVDHGKHEIDINKFPEELFKFANTTVNNTLVGRCCVSIEPNFQSQQMVILYHGNNMLDELCVSINIRTEIFFSSVRLHSNTSFTYVCSSNDYCDREYVEYWSKWLFKISLTQLKNNTQEMFKTSDNGDYESSMCYNMNKNENCSSHICYALYDNDKTIAKCAQQREIPYAMIRLPQASSAVLQLLKTVVVIIDTTIDKIPIPDSGNSLDTIKYKYKLRHAVSYFCTFNGCNSASISTAIAEQIKKNYDVQQMLDFIPSNLDKTTLVPITHSNPKTESSTQIIDTTYSTSTKMTNGTNRLISRSIIAFIFIYIYSSLLIN